METRTERHTFHNLPIKVSGGTVIARISGETLWRLREDGTVIMIRDTMLRGEEGELVEIGESDDLWCVIRDAIADSAKGLHTRSPRGDEVSSTPYDPSTPGDLDNARSEGAPS